MLSTIALILVAYLIGSISTSIIVCRLEGLPDPRTAGSGNPGSTNVLRLGGRIPALLTLLGDVLKGAIPVSLAIYFKPLPLVIGSVMVAAFLGHLYPLYFKFKGGKGVATYLGTLFPLFWQGACIFMGIWLGVALIFRFSSLASLIACFITPFVVWYGLGLPFAIPVALMSVLIFWKHRDNIARLWSGTESKIGKKSTS